MSMVETNSEATVVATVERTVETTVETTVEATVEPTVKETGKVTCLSPSLIIIFLNYTMKQFQIFLNFLE